MVAYTFDDVVIPGSIETHGTGINASGEIVGYSSTDGQSRHGFSYYKGVLTPIDVPNVKSTFVTGVNDSGELIGYVVSSDGSSSGFSETGGAVSPLDIPSSRSVQPTDINGRGQIIGTFSTQDGTQKSFLEYGGVYRTIYLSGTDSTQANAINKFGVVVGTYRSAGDESYHGFIDDGVRLGPIEFPNASGTFAFDVNDSGEIVGSYVASDRTYGFYEVNGTYVSIKAPGAFSTYATSVNNAGDVAGIYVDGNARQHGFVYKGGVFTTVDDPSGYDTYIDHINDAGQITGYTSSGGFNTAFVASLAGPTIAGTVKGQTTTDGKAISPFAAVALSDPNGGTDTITIALSGGGGTLAGAGLVANPDGTYTLTGTADTVQRRLDALVFTPAAAAPGTSATTTFTLTDASTGAPGQTATDANTTVTNTVAAAGPAPTPVPAPAPGTPGAVSLSPQVTYDHGTFTLTGTAASAAGIRAVEITATLEDGSTADLGAATVNSDGTFSFADFVGRHTQSFITATATDNAGGTAAAMAAYSLTGGLRQGTVRAEQDRYSADGSAVTAVDRFEADGTQRAKLEAGGQTVGSWSFDTFLNGRQPNNTFVFDPGYGLDVVRGFVAAGAGHDVLSFKGSDFGDDIAAVLANTHYEKGGAVITDPTSGDTVKLIGVTKAQLAANRDDIAFHA